MYAVYAETHYGWETLARNPSLERKSFYQQSKQEETFGGNTSNWQRKPSWQVSQCLDFINPLFAKAKEGGGAEGKSVSAPPPLTNVV